MCVVYKCVCMCVCSRTSVYAYDMIVIIRKTDNVSE